MSSSNKLPKILVIVGPTASGKTALSIKLAEKLGGEIVSADSRQIYRGMNIGTAKPPFSPTSQRVDTKTSVPRSNRGTQVSEGIPHHLIDIRNPNEDYSVADYKHDAIKVIHGILKRGKLPILVGGTGLYVKAVVENLDIPKVVANEKLRRTLETRLEKEGLETLFKELIALDPEAAYIVDPKNPRRVIRALEVALSTGKPFTAQRKKKKPLFETEIIGIALPPEKLRERIETRVDQMIQDGLVEETRNLYKKYGRVKALEAIGYREIIDYLEYCHSRGGGNPEVKKNLDSRCHGNDKKTQTLEEAIRQIKMNTRHYAKRQITWFRKDKNVLWIDPKNAIQTTSAISKKSL